jgi:hypothetical protein
MMKKPSEPTMLLLVTNILVSACAQSTTAGLASNMIKINEVAHLKTCTTN